MTCFSSPILLPEYSSGWFGDALYVIDFEGSTRTSVVEAGVVRMRANGEVSAWTSCFQPQGEVRWEDTATHGLRDEDLAGYPPFTDCFDLFKTMREEGILAAHHAVVENRFLCDVWPMPGWVPDRATGNGQVSSWGPWLDSRILAERLYPAMEDYRLSTLVATWGLQPALEQWAKRFCPPERCHYHCALYDALGSWLLLLFMAQQKGWHQWTTPRLLRLQQQGESNPSQQMDLLGL